MYVAVYRLATNSAGTRVTGINSIKPALDHDDALRVIREQTVGWWYVGIDLVPGHVYEAGAGRWHSAEHAKPGAWLPF